MSGYVYWQSEPGLWTVGTLGPGGCGPERNRHPESDHDSPEDAAARVSMLNGGHTPPAYVVPRPAPGRAADPPEAVDYLSDLLEVARDIRRVLEEIRDLAARSGGTLEAHGETLDALRNRVYELEHGPRDGR